MGRSIVGAEKLDYFAGREGIAKRIQAPAKFQMRSPITQTLAYDFLIPPFHGWSHYCRRWDVLAMDFEHLPDEAGGGPVAHNDFSAWPADALEFRGNQIRARREHGADQADDEIE